MPLTLSPEDVAALQPVPESAALTPEDVAQLTPVQPEGAMNIFHELSAEELADMARKNPDFDIAQTIHDDPSLKNDFVAQQKAADAFNLLKRDYFEGTPVISGIKHGDLGETLSGVGTLAKNVAGMAGGMVKYAGNIAEVAGGELGSAAEHIFGFGTPESRAQHQLDIQRQAVESIAGTETAIQGLIHQAGQIGGVAARMTPLAKQLKDYTPEERLQDFQKALFQKQLQKEASVGQGPLVSAVGSEVVKRLEAAGKPVRPEEVAYLAGGDPLSFMLFGKGMKGAGAVARATGISGAASAVANKIAAQLPTATVAGGNVIKAAGKTAEAATTGAEKISPVLGAAGGVTAAAHIPVIGEAFGLGHVAGALEGWRAGKAFATSLHKFGQKLSGIAAAGENIAKNTITGAYEQAAKDILESAPAAAGAIAHGAAFDLGLASTMDTPQERQAVGIGAAFGLLGAAKGMTQHALSGQLIAPRELAGAQVALPGSGAFPTFEAMNRASFDALAPGQKVRLNAVKTFLKGVNPKADIFVGATPVEIEKALVDQNIVDPATAKKWSEQNGMTFDVGDRKVVIMSAKGLDSAPHEARHAMENVIGEDALRQVDADILARYPVDEIGRQYTFRLTGTDEGANWREALLDETGKGAQDAAEKLIQQHLAAQNDLARGAGTEPPTEAEVRSLVESEVKQNGLDWRTVLTPEEQAASANRYIAREIAAENYDAWFEHTGGTNVEGKQIPQALARWAGDLMKYVGAEPLTGRVSKGLGIPLSREVVEATAKQAGGLRPVIEPGKKTAPVAPSLPRTPEEVTKSATDAANLAKTAPDVPLPGAAKSQREILGITAEAIANRGAIKLNYLSAPDEPAAAISSNRVTRREMIELFRRMPEEARKLWEKTFFPESVGVTKEGKYQVQGWAPEVFAANAQKLAEVMATTPEMVKLSPYAIDPATKSFTREGWLDLYGDVQRFVANQQAGFTGSGLPLVVPRETAAKGFFKPPEKAGQNLALDQNRADFVNMLFNFKLPSTNKLGHGKFPLNLAGQDISKATLPGRLVEPLTPRAPFEGERARELGIEGRTIQEVNPLRAQMEQAAAAAGVKMPSFIEAIQKLNLERILEADHAPEAPQFRGNTLTLSAGFMPAEGKREIELTGPDGKTYRARFDGYQDMTILGKGFVPQITPLEDLPGVTIKDSTTYGPKLLSAGYKLPADLPAPATPQVQFMHSLEGIKKMNDEEVARQKRGAESETTRMSSHTGDADTGLVLHSAKNRSTIFVPPGKQSEQILKELGDAKTDQQKNTVIEAHYAEAQFMPKDQGYEAKEFWLGKRLEPSPTGHYEGALRLLKTEQPKEHARIMERLGENPSEMALDAARAAAYNRMMEKNWVRVVGLNRELSVDPTPEVNSWQKVPRTAREQLEDVSEATGKPITFGGKTVYEPRASEESQFMPKPKKGEEEPLPHAMGTGRLPVVHYGNTPELTRLDPELMGAGRATSGDKRGIPKTFFFVQGSEFGGDVSLFKGKQAYMSNIDKAKLYDTTQGDPLDYFGGNRIEAEEGIRKAGYDGVYVETQDGRKVVAMFRAGAVKDIGRAEETGSRALGPVEQLPGLEPGIRVKGKQLFKDSDLQKKVRYYISNVDALTKTGVLTMKDWGENGYPVENGYVDKKGKWVSAADAFKPLNPEGLRSENVSFLPGGAPEAIKAAAIRDRDNGKIYEGFAHFAARQEAMKDGYGVSKLMNFEDGFTTNGGEFLNREEAFKRAVELQQYKPTNARGAAGYLDRNKKLESVTFEHQQKMKEMGYAPDVQFTPALPDKFNSPEFEKTLKEVRAGKLFGSTFNTNGTKWEPKPEDRLDIVSLASLNVPQGKLNVAAVDKFLAPFEDLLDEGNVKLGTFSFSKDGVPMVSIDLNATVDQKHRANTIKFAKDNDQVSIWDSHKGEEVLTGGKGNTRLKSLAELYEALKPLSKGKPVDVKGIIADNAGGSVQESLGLDDETVIKRQEKNMTKAELAARYPESVIPPTRDAALRAKIVESPLYKAAGSEVAAVKAFAKGLVDFAKEYKDHPVFQAGLKWYSEAVPKLKKTFGKDAPIVAELLAATSPQNNPRQNYAYSIEALETYKAGKYDRHMKGYLEGLKKLETDEWQAGGAKTKAQFMKDWIKKNDLLPRQSNGALFGIASRAVLQVLTRTWLTSVEGPKVSQFVQNLLGTDHGATIDVWAGQRTMRRIGYSGFVDRWRILPKNDAAISDADFAFSQKAFSEAAKQLGVLPDALQGGLWFAEKQLWSDRGYGKLNLGSFVTEMDKTGELQKGVQKRLFDATPEGQKIIAEKRAANQRAAEKLQPDLFVTPRPEK